MSQVCEKGTDSHYDNRNAQNEMEGGLKRKTNLNYKKQVENYLKRGDWRVKENSTVPFSLGGLILSNSGAITAHYWLSEIYDEEIADAHRNADFHIHDLSVLSGYCAGHSLGQLVMEGLGGVRGKVTSAPPKHLVSLCNQMVNFIGIMQNEWAGAQAFSSFDTYLAPFVKADNLSYDTTKKCIESFVYGVNTPGRWGCVDQETEVLAVTGFKKYNELQEGDEIYTWNQETGNLELNKVNKVVTKYYSGFLHSYQNGSYVQTVTPNHRVLVYKDNFIDTEIRLSEEAFYDKTPCALPARFRGSALSEADITDDEIVMAGDGEIAPLPEMMKMSFRQAQLFLKVAGEQGMCGIVVACENQDEIDIIQQVGVLAGYTSYVVEDEDDVLFSDDDVYVVLRDERFITPIVRMEVPYSGLVWCPNVDNGTAVFRKNGNVFVSGQTQPPFSNITLDWTVPADMADQPAYIGGKPSGFTYGDCQKEMDMINKAFLEIMIEGDAAGRGFQYPIPTYSITKDFDWSDTENNRLLFELTAKYGAPYFSNYVNSDMDPSSCRSMCPLYGKQKVLVRDDYSKEFHLSAIENLYNSDSSDKSYTILCNGLPKRAVVHRFDGMEFYKITFSNGHSVVFSGNHQNLTMDGLKTTVELTDEDYLPFDITPTEGVGFDYDDGLMVGAFMGDGTISADYAITLSLNDGSKKEIMDRLVALAESKYGAKTSTDVVKNSCTNVRLTSKMLRGLIDDYVSGKGLTKELSPKCISRSLDFRRGIVDGLMATDGNAKSRRIYTASIKGLESMAAVFASLGIPTSIHTDYRDSTATLSDNPVYSIRPYRFESDLSVRGGLFKKTDEYMWFRVVSVEKLQSNATLGYCFEVLDDKKPYFMMPNGLVTHNCRLRLDLRELRKKSGGYFGSGESTGSIGVVTLNLPRIAYLSEDKEDFYERLDRLMDLAAKSLKIKRTVITKLLNDGLYPYTKHYLGTFNNHFSTIGLVGMNEVGLNANWLGEGMMAPETREFAIEVLNHMRERLSDYQEQYGDLYNLEATPAESTAYRLAKHDVEQFPDIRTANDNGTPYYTNSTHLPVNATDDIFEALSLQDELQTLYTSGTVFHGFLGERLSGGWESAAKLVKAISDNYRLPYYTLSPTYSVCPDHGYIAGEVPECPTCGKLTEVYSRITGYYRPISNWNDGKQQEFNDRMVYKVE